ncbi:MAG: hypothetical protein LBN12_02125 [Clostridiales Family XIII bacterium]|jgi:hypothetical protein|nr:hypothetical protein [Clostridiales Family XIII bacterium]
MKNTIKDLTLMLLYLTAWEEKTPFDETFKSSWKGRRTESVGTPPRIWVE